MGDFAAFKRWVDKVEQVVDGTAQKRILTKAGMAGKQAALDAAGAALGGDRKFSHWKGKPALAAGYDLGSSDVTINFRPAGMWKLAEDGRHSSGLIFPKRGRSKGKQTVSHKAVLTPQGPRSRSSYSRSRGLKAYTQAAKKAQTSVPKAAHDQMNAEIRRVLG